MNAVRYQPCLELYRKVLVRNTQRIIFFSGLGLLVLRCNSSPSLCVVLLLQLLQPVQRVVALTAVTMSSLLQGFVS